MDEIREVFRMIIAGIIVVIIQKVAEYLSSHEDE